MPTIAPVAKGFEKTIAPEGTHLARCVSFIHIGTNEEDFQGEPKDFNKIRLGFELPEELHTFKAEIGDQPLVISQEYTLSMNEKANLRKLIEGILGHAMQPEEADTFDVEGLVGKACLVNIKHKTSAKGNVRAEIATASPLMKKQVCPAQITPSKVLAYDSFNEEVFNSLPDFLKEKIVSSKEYQAMKGLPDTSAMTLDDFSDSIDTSDIPFD